MTMAATIMTATIMMLPLPPVVVIATGDRARD